MLTLRMLRDPRVVEDVGDATPGVHEIPSLLSADRLASTPSLQKGHTAASYLFASLGPPESVVVRVLEPLTSSDSKSEGNPPGNDKIKLFAAFLATKSSYRAIWLDCSPLAGVRNFEIFGPHGKDPVQRPDVQRIRIGFGEGKYPSLLRHRAVASGVWLDFKVRLPIEPPVSAASLIF